MENEENLREWYNSDVSEQWKLYNPFETLTIEYKKRLSESVSFNLYMFNKTRRILLDSVEEELKILFRIMG